ncbi:VOC family protein [Solimonas variicoloris]|uniref:VOC family protein n=1 Tax=Solimonas variicoloris TaxID=254408 RepID=UPI00036FEC3D|nr:VOC family protein [Solimonas variicoloris]
MLDHVGLVVADYERSKAFYRAALAPLGFELLMELAPPVVDHAHGGFGAAPKPEFWISASGGAARPNTPPVHIALRARTRAEVDAFHRAALAAGGRDNGAPGLRPHYHPNYYGAFVLDPDGHNIEAVCHAPA